MSQWIIGFPPLISGCYLIRSMENKSYMRFEYDSINNKWYPYSGLNCTTYSVILSLDKNEWWDEYKIAQEKRIKKLKF